MSEVKIAASDHEIIHCFDVMHELRPHLKREEFVLQVRRMMKETYTLAYIDDGGKAVCASGFRFEEMLFRGKSIYVDDLVTLPDYRSKKYGGKMIDWIIELARKKDCKQVHLDSGVQRFDAHRFYLNNGFDITSHHFAMTLK